VVQWQYEPALMRIVESSRGNRCVHTEGDICHIVVRAAVFVGGGSA
jgi:hypothetical protein